MTDASTPTPTPVPAEDEGFVDFSDQRKPVRFAAQGQRYECHEALSVATTQQVAHVTNGLNPDDVLGALGAFFALVMDEASAARIDRQLREQRPDSLTAEQGAKIMRWVVEQYASRPTLPPSD